MTFPSFLVCCLIIAGFTALTTAMAFLAVWLEARRGIDDSRD